MSSEVAGRTAADEAADGTVGVGPGAAEEAARGDGGVRYRREELATAAGVKVRNLRYYQERGLLPAPRREGRVAWYSEEHLARLRLIDDLLGRGYTVNGIAELLATWEQGGTIAQLLGVEREMTRDWVQEEPVTVSLAELRRMFGPAATPRDTRRAAALEYVRVDGDTVTFPSRRLLEATLTLVRQGVPLAEILDAGDFVQTQAAALADRFVALFRRHVIGPEGLGRLSATQLDRVAEAAGALRPVAGEVVAAEFARAMARRVEAEVAALLRTEQ
ncbi:MerR family transcriptional regulator [Streptomyces sp. NBC_01216]|uniref:MerR family transcriptional regulator n=1 Tax=unclassified Streptomyces TaxID=2593676 RepID=UPI002E128720|nr:MerR family transcriptional regulator [Streptomyces sp. NBC_01216]